MLPDEYISFCGGSILNEWWILTAAHCCDEVSGFNVVAGGVSLQTSEPDIEQKSSVSSDGIFIHEKYGENGTNNDLCLLKVCTPHHFISFLKKYRAITFIHSQNIDASLYSTYIFNSSTDRLSLTKTLE